VDLRLIASRLRTIARLARNRARYVVTWIRLAARGARWPARREVYGEIMREDWDGRARDDAMYWVATRQRDWDAEEFFASGEYDLERICERSGVALGPGRTVLEIGCGVGRLMRAVLARGAEAWGIDISPEMVERARQNLEGHGSFHLMVQPAHDLSALPPDRFDLVYSFVVLQHLPHVDLVLACVSGASRLLAPGGVMAMQCRGDTGRERTDDTYTGASVTPEALLGACRERGLVDVSVDGAGTQYQWVVARRPGGREPGKPGAGAG
jgi:SAM-dependent methyltransferase